MSVNMMAASRRFSADTVLLASSFMGTINDCSAGFWSAPNNAGEDACTTK